jgi:hypothetical protein
MKDTKSLPAAQAGAPNNDPRQTTPSALLETPTPAGDARERAGETAARPDRLIPLEGAIDPFPGYWMNHGVSVGEPKHLFVGCANTGAKFTPKNHQGTGDGTLDRILRGQYMPIGIDAIVAETEGLYERGVRYLHWHPRNPATREQSCELPLFREFSLNLRQRFPGLALSFGGSRNGPEIQQAIAGAGEWARIQQAALALHEGGAEFVTIQAAAELTVILDLERQGYLRWNPAMGDYDRLKPLDGYIASRLLEPLSIEAHSTSGGAKYGDSSAAEQLRVLARAISARSRLNLPQEVEWTQLDRSYALTRLLLEELRPSLGGTGRLNITLLFGFSPKMPFPMSYGEFRRAVRMARSLEKRTSFPPMHLTISVGAAVLPQRANQLVRPLDIGPYRGARVTSLERLVAYACQPDSDVDLIRTGIEDHPFLLDDHEAIVPATNLDLVDFVIEKIEKHGGRVITDPVAVRHFVSTEGRPYYERSEAV